MPDTLLDKAVHRVQAAALEPWFAVAREGCTVLEVGVGAGRWVSSFDLGKTRFAGVDISQDMVDAAYAKFPEGRFDRLGQDLLFPYDDESFDLVFSVGYMRHNSTSAKRTLVSEMWRVARLGGVVIFLEDFVFEKRTVRSDIYPMTVLAFVDLIIEATAGRVVLEHVESLHYPHENVLRSGVISLSKLGFQSQGLPDASVGLC